MARKKPYNLYLSDEAIAELKRRAEADGRSPSAYLERLILRPLDLTFRDAAKTDIERADLLGKGTKERRIR
jgi:hypothetical protein